MRKAILLSTVSIFLTVAVALAAQSVMGDTGYQSIMGSTHPATIMGTTQSWTSDHTLTFDIAANADEYGLYGLSGPSWPPSFNAATSGYSSPNKGNQYDGENNDYRWNIGLMNFDTSSIPDGATIVSATLKTKLKQDNDMGGRNLECGYYTWSGTPGSGQFNETVTASAFSKDITAISTTATEYTETLSNVSNVSKTSYTGFKFYVSGAAPASGSYATNAVTVYGKGAHSYVSRLTVVANY